MSTMSTMSTTPTTSGVCVTNNGVKYMTCASHGFP